MNNLQQQRELSMEHGGTISTRPKPLIIGFSGKIGSGKTTVCELLKRLLSTRLELSITNISFGEVLKRNVADTFQFPLEWCYSTDGKCKYVRFTRDYYVLEESVESFKDDMYFKKQVCIIPMEKGMSVRTLLQWWGTEVARKHCPDFWTNAWSALVAKSTADVILVDDVRFPNELETIYSKGGGVFRVIPYAGWDYYSDHESETALDGHDFGGDYWAKAPDYGHNFLQQIAWDIFQDVHNGSLVQQIAARGK